MDDPKVSLEVEKFLCEDRALALIIKRGFKDHLSLEIANRATRRDDDPVSQLPKRLELGLDDAGHASGSEMVVNDQDGH